MTTVRVRTLALLVTLTLGTLAAPIGAASAATVPHGAQARVAQQDDSGNILDGLQAGLDEILDGLNAGLTGG